MGIIKTAISSVHGLEERLAKIEADIAEIKGQKLKYGNDSDAPKHTSDGNSFTHDGSEKHVAP